MLGNTSPFWPPKYPPTIDVPETNLFFNLFVSANRFPQKIAYVDQQVSITYGELIVAVEKLAGYLQEAASVKKGDRVLLYMQNSVHYVIAYYAILRANAVVVPLNPMNKASELKHYAVDSGAISVITTGEEFCNIEPLLEQGQILHAIVGTYGEHIALHAAPQEPIRAARSSAVVTSWASAVGAGHQPGPLLTSSTDLAVLIYTSGTTGKPKGCKHTHHSIMSGIANSVCWHKLSQVGNLLATVPMFHVTGMQTNMNVPIFLGNTVVLLRRWNAAAAMALIEQYGITEWTAIATMIVDLLGAAKGRTAALSSLRYLRGGGAPMPEALAQQLNDIYGVKYIEGYGLTETMAAVLFNPPHYPKLQCAGLPMFNVKALVVDPLTLQPLAQGKVGEILLCSAQLFSGYWNQPDADRETFLDIDGDRFMRTGDLGYVDQDGYFFIVDRIKRMINASGFKVWPAEIENFLYQHPAIQEACVIAARDPHRGETVKAVVVAKPDWEGRISAEEIIAWSKEHLAAYKYPRQIEFRRELPRSSTGKVDWRRLQDEESSSPIAQCSRVE